MNNANDDGQDRYISISKAMSILNVRFERVTWFIATGELPSKPDPRDKSRKVVSLRDVHGATRYIGRAYEPQVRLKQYLNENYTSNPAKYRWLRELKKSGLQPRMEILEGVNGTLQDADARERVWIRHFIDSDAELTNVQYMS